MGLSKCLSFLMNVFTSLTYVDQKEIKLWVNRVKTLQDGDPLRKPAHIKGNEVWEELLKPPMSLDSFAKHVAVHRKDIFVTQDFMESGQV